MVKKDLIYYIAGTITQSHKDTCKTCHYFIYNVFVNPADYTLVHKQAKLSQTITSQKQTSYYVDCFLNFSQHHE